MVRHKPHNFGFLHPGQKMSEYFMEKYTLEFMGIEKYEDFHTAKVLSCKK